MPVRYFNATEYDRAENERNFSLTARHIRNNTSSHLFAIRAITILILAAFLSSCTFNHRRAELPKALSAANFDLKSVTFSPKSLDIDCLLEDSCVIKKRRAYTDSLRNSGKILSFIVAKSIGTDKWEDGYTAYFNYWSEFASNEYKYAMSPDAYQEHDKIDPEQIVKSGYKIYSIDSCNDTVAANEIIKRASKNELLGECISFTGIRCDSLMTKCLVTAQINEEPAKGASYWMLLKKEKGKWREKSSFNRMHWNS